MRDPALVPLYMAPLCERLAACGPHDRELVPLFESVIMVSGHGGQQQSQRQDA